MNWIRFLEPFGVDIFCLRKKFLVFHLVERDLKIRYRRSVIGIFWTLLVPLANATVYFFVFRIVLKAPIPNYLIFILSGMLPWGFLSQSVIAGMESIVGNYGLLTKVPIPIQIFPFTITLSNLINLVLAFPILIGACLLSGVPLTFNFLFFFYYATLLFFIAYSLAMILAIAYVYLRDLRHLVNIGIQFLFYLSPVLYGTNMIPEKHRWVLYANPLALLFSGLHVALAEGNCPNLLEIVLPFIWTIVFLMISLALQKSFSRKLVENL